ncbi:MAG: PAS domain-containing protein, partial [Acetobacteraceae bacterium]
RLLIANAQAAEICGQPPDELAPGRTREELLRLQLARGSLGPGEAGEARLQELLRRDPRIPTRERRRLANDRIVEIVAEPTRQGGRVITFTDITALVTAEAEARDRAALLQTMQDTMRHGIAFFGSDHRLIMANALATDLAGLQPGDGRPGMSVTELNAIRLRRGVFESSDAEIHASGRDRSRPHQSRRTLPDGRVVEALSDPTPDGGFVMSWTDVTALARAEAAAEQRAATLQAMIENMGTGVALFGADHRLMAANRLVEDLAGYAPGELQPGSSLEELLATQAPGAATGDINLDREYRALALGADRSRPLRYIRPAPAGRMVEVASAPMPDGGFVITLSDITALARAEAEAKQQAQIQAVMLSTIRHGIALYGPDHRLIAVNRLTTVISGTTEEQVRPGVSFAEVVRHQAAMGGLGRNPEAEVERLLSLDRRQPQHYRREASDGRMIEVHSDPTPDGGFAITFSDITALVAAETAARSRAAMLQAALDTMRHGIMLFGPDHRLLAANALATEIGGLSAEELRPGILLEEQVREHHARGMYGPEPEASATRDHLLAADRSLCWRRTRKMPDGRVVEVFSDPTPEGGFVVTFTDVTAQAQAEAEARQRAATLQVTMDNVHHGIAMYGPDRRLVVANRLAGPQHGLPNLHERPGVLFEDLVCEQRVLGFFGPDPEAARIAAEVIGLDRRKAIRPSGSRRW